MGQQSCDFRGMATFRKSAIGFCKHFPLSRSGFLFLDADEEITPAFERAFSERIGGGGVDGVWLRYDNFFQGKKLKFGLPQKKLAAFKVGKGFYERIKEKRWSSLDMEVHEHPIITGRVGFIREPILHHDYNGIDRFVKRHCNYADWEVGRYLALRELSGELGSLNPKTES